MSVDRSTPELGTFSERRREIGEGIAAVERALSAPAGSAVWQPRLIVALEELRRLAVAQHDAVAAPDGLFVEIRRDHPGLGAQVDEIKADFDAALASLESLLPEADLLAPVELRRRALALLGSAVELRQAIADVVWEAYWVDVGGPG